MKKNERNFEEALKNLIEIHERNNPHTQPPYKKPSERVFTEFSPIDEPLTPEEAEKTEKNERLIFMALRPEVESAVPLHPLATLYLRKEGRDSENAREMLQAARAGLMRAVQKHEKEKGAFSTYAICGIRGAVLKCFSYKEKAEAHQTPLDKENLEIPVQEDAPVFENEVVLQKLERIFKHTENERNFTIYVLKRGLGHSTKAIMKEYRIGRERVRRIVLEVHKRLPPELKFKNIKNHPLS